MKNIILVLLLTNFISTYSSEKSENFLEKCTPEQIIYCKQYGIPNLENLPHCFKKNSARKKQNNKNNNHYETKL